MSGPGDAEPTPSADRWQVLAAVSVLVDDSAPGSVARYARVGGLGPVSHADAADALDRARVAGWFDADDRPTASTEAQCDGLLTSDQRSTIETELALTLLAAGPDRLADGLRRARAAIRGPRTSELVAALDRAGGMALALGEYGTADELLSLAAACDLDPRGAAAAARLCDLAEVADGLGDGSRVRSLLVHAFAVADAAGATSQAARSAVALALFDDGVVADGRAAALLRRVAALDLSADDRVAVDAARAMVERRLPTVVTGTRPVAWVSRPSVGRTLADAALVASSGTRIESRALALRGWRVTHTAAAFLHRRREVSAELLDLTQQFRSPVQQYDAAEWVAVDALEDGDRAEYDRAVDLARWLSRRDGTPRLVRRGLLLGAGSALLDGDVATATSLYAEASSYDTVGDPLAEMIFAAQIGVDRMAIDGVSASSVSADDDRPGSVIDPLRRVVIAAAHAARGDHEGAEHHLRRAFRHLEPEQDALLVSTRLASVALDIGALDLCREVVGVLAPWAGHVAVDGRGWWCDGPVALHLARVHLALGDLDAAWHALEQGEPTARSVHDVRACALAAEVRSQLTAHGPPPEPVQLTTRELQVLTLIASGSTNPQIAQELAHSVATIRADTISIYRKLGARGRADASARAQALGIIGVSRPVAPTRVERTRR